MTRNWWTEDGPGRRELDLHGLLREEGLRRLRDTVEACGKHGVRRLRIVHGKGTGVLRAMVWEHLEFHPRVAEIRAALPREGGEGATVVVLRPGGGGRG